MRRMKDARIESWEWMMHPLAVWHTLLLQTRVTEASQAQPAGVCVCVCVYVCVCVRACVYARPLVYWIF